MRSFFGVFIPPSFARLDDIYILPTTEPVVSARRRADPTSQTIVVRTEKGTFATYMISGECINHVRFGPGVKPSDWRFLLRHTLPATKTCRRSLVCSIFVRSLFQNICACMKCFATREYVRICTTYDSAAVHSTSLHHVNHIHRNSCILHACSV